MVHNSAVSTFFTTDGMYAVPTDPVVICRDAIYRVRFTKNDATATSVPRPIAALISGSFFVQVTLVLCGCHR